MASRDTLDDIDILAFWRDKSAVWPLAKAVSSTALYPCHSSYSLSADAVNDLRVSMDWKGEVWRCDSDTTITGLFLLLARYVPNVAKRSIWEQCKKKYILTTDRPTTSHLGKFKWPYLRKGSSDPLYVWFYCGFFEFGIGGSNGVISGLTKFNRYVGETNARGVIRLVTI